MDVDAPVQRGVKRQLRLVAASDLRDVDAYDRRDDGRIEIAAVGARRWILSTRARTQSLVARVSAAGRTLPVPPHPNAVANARSTGATKNLSGRVIGANNRPARV